MWKQILEVRLNKTYFAMCQVGDIFGIIIAEVFENDLSDKMSVRSLSCMCQSVQYAAIAALLTRLLTISFSGFTKLYHYPLTI